MFHPSQPSFRFLSFAFVTLSAEGLSRMNGKPNADENREGGREAESGRGREKRRGAIGDDGGGRAVWAGSTGDMSHGEQSPRGLVGAVYKWK